MSKKHHGGPAPIPPGNRPTDLPPGTRVPDAGRESVPHEAGDEFQNQDPQRRLGGFGGAGEHPLQQPSGLNDGDRHSR